MKAIMNWIQTHPRLAGWAVLGLGMDLMVIYEAREVGLAVGQWVALIIATSLVAGLCVWIIGWDDDEDDNEESAPAADPPAKAG